MPDPQIVWRGLTLGGDDWPDVDVHGITGWDDLPEVSTTGVARTRGHGSYPGQQFGGERIVTVTGMVSSRRSRDTLALALSGASPVSSAVEPLAVTTFGRTLWSGAQLIRRTLPVDDDYASGAVPFSMQWRCPDPLRYGAAQTATTGLPTSGGGLVFPLTFPLTFGALGATGQIQVGNPGSADSPLLLRVTGGLPQGFEVSASWRRLRYVAEVPAGQTVVLNTADGSVLVEGTANRRANLTIADWIQVPAGGSLALQFTSLGGAYDPAATLTATWAEANW